MAVRPLDGKTILITRPRQSTLKLQELLEDQGARVMFQPTIEILPPENWESIDPVLKKIDTFDWLIFSSGNGVTFFFERLRQHNLCIPEGIKIAAVGPGTATILAEQGSHTDLVPKTFCAEGLIESFTPMASGQRFLSVRGSRGRDVLQTELVRLGAVYEEIAVYRSVDVTVPSPTVCHFLDMGQIDAITVTSSAIAASLATLFGQSLLKTKLVSISPLTSEAIIQAGFTPSIEAANATMEGLVTAMINSI